MVLPLIVIYNTFNHFLKSTLIIKKIFVRTYKDGVFWITVHVFGPQVNIQSFQWRARMFTFGINSLRLLNRILTLVFQSKGYYFHILSFPSFTSFLAMKSQITVGYILTRIV